MRIRWLVYYKQTKMADELVSNLSTYKLQLQQVEASLTVDPDNEDLLKLKKDLQEVIDLTKDLIGKTEEEIVEASSAGSSGEASHSIPAGVEHVEWHSGDHCLAMWSADHQFHPATVDEVLEDGSCTVKFDGYDTTEVTETRLLKIRDKDQVEMDASQRKSVSKKDLIAKQREYKKKKSQKKAQRLKQMEEEREQEKNKWLDFNSKTFAKTNKGKVKKSIFSTPDSVGGRVGVGTCGVGGKPMTQFRHHEKWKK